MVDFEDLLSREEAARKLGVKPQTLTSWASMGRGPDFIKVGRACMYTHAALQDFLQQNLHRPQAEKNSVAARTNAQSHGEPRKKLTVKQSKSAA